MSDSTQSLQQLEDEERALQLQMDRIKAAKRAAIEEANRKAIEAMRNKEIVLHVVTMSGSMIMLESEYCEELVQIYRTIPGRTYRGARENMIPVGEWKNFLTKVAQVSRVKLEYAASVKEEIELTLNAPAWTIRLKPRNFEAVPARNTNTFVMHRITGAELEPQYKKFWRVPLTEGWKLFEVLEHVEGVVWDDDAAEFVRDQIQRRASLDQIAKLDRGVKYFDFDMNGMKLRHFQEVGAEFIDAAGGRALLADEMGLGKTWQSLAYAIKNGYRTVIICPASLKPNWAREVRKLSGERPTVLYGSEPTNHDIVAMLTQPPQFTIINYDIAGRKSEVKKVTKDQQGYEHVKYENRFMWIELINMSKPDLVIIDEGHYIKNVDSNRSQALRTLQAPRVICMTGTPVLNRPGELWPMLTLLAPETFPAYETFLKQYTFDGKTARNVEELRVLLRSIMIRRLKKDVVADLPPINRINDYHELSGKALKLYRKVEQGVYETLAEYSASGSGGNEMSITNILTQIQRLKQVCAIDKVASTANMAMEMYDQTDESGNRKVLIFTQYKPVAYAIYQRLADEGCLSFVSRGKNEFITAGNAERDQMVQQFQTDPKIKYLVVTEKTAKEGHNITAAGHVIFNDLFWTPAAHEQGEARAYGRLSDLHSIDSYYRVTDMDGDSIEEWIVDLLDMKSAMINEVVEGVEAGRDVSIATALIDKMKEKMWTRGK